MSVLGGHIWACNPSRSCGYSIYAVCEKSVQVYLESKGIEPKCVYKWSKKCLANSSSSYEDVYVSGYNSTLVNETFRDTCVFNTFQWTIKYCDIKAEDYEMNPLVLNNTYLRTG